MRGLGLVLLVLAVLSATGGAEVENGLVAHWDFDEGQGDVLHDRSGNGNDGLIRNAAWVASPRGHALSFNGQDSEVEIGPRPGLNLSGDVTFEAWVKTTDDTGRDRLIYGDDASLEVNRNLLFCIDKGNLYTGRGNGQEREALTVEIEFDGKWKHIAVIYEYPRAYVYENGRLIKIGEMAVPVSQTQGGKRMIGGWWAGRFKGEIDEIRLYNRALPEREVRSHHAGKALNPEPAIELSPHVSFLSKKVTVDIACRNAPGNVKAATVTIARSDAQTSLRTAAAALRPTRPDSERAIGSVTAALDGLEPGTYVVTATARTAEDETVGRGEAKFVWPAKPSWFGSQAGITDEVLPPYTPVEVVQSPEGVSARVTGRQYDFADGPFLKQVRTAGADMLAGPMQLIAEIEGQQVTWTPSPTQLAASAPNKVSLQQQVRGQGTSLSLSSAVEYDGLVTTRWKITADRPATITRLTLEVPVKQQHALYLYTWPTAWGAQGYSGAIKEEGHRSQFKAMIWLGDNERGISWFCESPQNWHPADPDKAFEVLPQGDRVVLQMNIVEKPVKLETGESLEYTFAFQATPLKPIQKDGWARAFTRIPWYGHDYDVLTQRIANKPALDYLKEKGFRTVIAFNWTPVLSYPAPLDWGDKLRALVQACHERDMQVIVYLGFLVSERASEYEAFKEDVVRGPVTPFPDQYPGQEMQMSYLVCLRGPWQDALAHYVAKLMDDYGIDGIYLDTTVLPFECRNELHGCGYTDATGKRAATYPIMDVRRTLQRLYAVVKQRKPDGIVDAHVWDCVNSAALAYATNYWNGEQLSKSGHVPDGLSLDRFRTEFMGVNWGVPADFLHYQLGDFRQCHALSLIHDVLIRPATIEEIELESSILQLGQRFGREEAEFLPYWANRDYVTIAPAESCVSLYRHPRNGTLAIVSNLGKAEARVSLSLNLEKLGLPAAGLSVSDGLTGAPLRLDGNVIQPLDLPTMGWQYIWVRPAR